MEMVEYANNGLGERKTPPSSIIPIFHGGDTWWAAAKNLFASIIVELGEGNLHGGGL